MRGRLKYTVIATALCTLFIFAVTGCSKNAGNTGNKEAQGGDSLENMEFDKLVKLGDYKNLSVTLDDTSISDEEIEEALKEALYSKKTTETVTDRPVENGDTVNIDYEGKKDGVAFDGGTAKGYDLTIGSGTFIPGFEEGLIGAKTGETKDLNLTFPENYQSADLAGQDVVFTVKVNSIKTDVYPELTDELAKELDSKVSGAKEYRENLENNLKKVKEDSALTKAYSDLLSKVRDNSEIASGKDIPEWMIEENKKAQKESFERSLEMYGMDLETYLKQQGMTEENFDETLEAYAETEAKEQLLIYALAKAENITISEADIEAQYEKDADTYGYSSAEEFKEAVKAQGAENTFKEATLTRKVEEMLYSYAKK